MYMWIRKNSKISIKLQVRTWSNGIPAVDTMVVTTFVAFTKEEYTDFVLSVSAVACRHIGEWLNILKTEGKLS
jgi:hypothetical protein